MRIAYISTIQVPSAKANSIQVMKMCQAMTQLGHDVTLILPGEYKREIADQEWVILREHYGLNDQFKIQYLSRSKNWQKRIFELKALKLARSINADVIYTRTIPPGVLGLLMHFSVILEIHQMPSGRFGPLWFQQFLKLNGHKRLIVITYSLKQQIINQYKAHLDRTDLIVAPSGVDLERFYKLPDFHTARKLLGLKDIITGVCTGHLYSGRGMQHFVNLAKELPDLQFIWVGGEKGDAQNWNRTAKNNGITNVLFTGFKPNQVLPLYQAAADFLVIPYESFISGSGGGDISGVSSPLKMFEYLASGRPIISSDLPVLHEVLNEKNAIFCPPGDLVAWKSAIFRILTNQKLRRELSVQAKVDANCYSWNDRSRKILANF